MGITKLLLFVRIQTSNKPFDRDEFQAKVGFVFIGIFTFGFELIWSMYSLLS